MADLFNVKCSLFSSQVGVKLLFVVDLESEIFMPENRTFHYTQNLQAHLFG